MMRHGVFNWSGGNNNAGLDGVISSTEDDDREV